MVEFTEWAVEILRKADAAARRFNPDARVRVYRRGPNVEFGLTDTPQPGDTSVERDGFTILVEQGIDGVIDVVEPHDRLILRPPGSSA